MTNDAQIDIEDADDDEDEDGSLSLHLASHKALAAEVKQRCKAASIEYEEVDDDIDLGSMIKISLPNGREHRACYFWSAHELRQLLAFKFESYVYLSGYEAVANYENGTIEAVIRPISIQNYPGSGKRAYAAIFGDGTDDFVDNWDNQKVEISSPDSTTKISLAPASDRIRALISRRAGTVASITIQRNGIKRQEDAISLLRSLSDAIFLQIDMLQGASFSIMRSRPRRARRAGRRKEGNIQLSYPKYEFDFAPTSLYWYAKSAIGMPLLQFLAYYQVVEFYYPTYSQADAKRRLGAILKDPTFRGDRDSDLGRVLSAVQHHKNGAIGDERS